MGDSAKGATYSFTTDGSIGSINSQNIVSFDVSIVQGTQIFALNQANGAVFGSRIVATSTGLTFGSAGFERALQVRSFAEQGNISDAFFQIEPSGVFFRLGDGPLASFAVTLPFAAADGGPVSPVPEPATWAMMLVGFGMVAGAARYRRRSTTAAIA